MSPTSSSVWAPAFFESVICAPSPSGDEPHSAGRTSPAEIQDSATVRPQRQRRTVVSVDGIPVADLLAQIRAGDREALARLYRATFDDLWTIAAIRTRSSAIAEEIVQDVFLRLWVRREHLNVDTDIGLYLAVAVRNQARDIGKHSRVVDTTASAVVDAGADIPAMGQPIMNAEQQLEDAELRLAYHRAIATLTEQERTAVLLRWEKGWTFEQVGEVLGMSKVGARKVLLRAQQKVQALLADYRG